jgi:hypothetical protein
VPRAPALHQDWNEREHAESGKRREDLRGERVGGMEDERAIRAARRNACGARGFLRHDHAIQAAPNECKRERRRHDAEYGRRRKRHQPHPARGRDEIDQPEREYRNESQKKQIAECILAKARSDLLCRCARAARQVLAECTPCDREDDDRSDARADNSGHSTEQRAEKHSADYSQISSNRQRKRHNPDIKGDVACDRERLVRGNELAQRVVMPIEHLKRELPVPSQRDDNDGDNSDSDQRRQTPQRELPAAWRNT